MECVRCGSEGRQVEASVMGAPAVALGNMCDGCLCEGLDGHALWKAEFERLLRRGLSRSAANAEIIRRMDAGEPPPRLLN